LTGIVQADEANIVMPGPTVRNRPIRPFDAPAGRSEITVDRGGLLSRRLAGRSSKRSSQFRYPAERKTNGHRAA